MDNNNRPQDSLTKPNVSLPVNYPKTIEQLLKMAFDQKASDLHLTPGKPPIVRVYGKLINLECPDLNPADVEALVTSILHPYHRTLLNEKWELDFSYSLPGLSGFRANVMKQRSSLAATFRLVPYTPPDIDELGLPSIVKDLCHLQRGLILVTGSTGHGKSTTLAAMINYINHNRNLNIITVEDPIEFLHKHSRSMVKQREVGTDTRSFADALRHALRHDPDVILVGEMRDMDSIAIALEAAETGHLVLSTLHTQNAAMSVSRIIDVFKDYMQGQVRQQVTGTLQAVIAQQLVPRANGEGQVLAAEILLSSPAVKNLIREGKEHQIYSVIQTNRGMGMQTMDQSLADLVDSGLISKETALDYCVDKPELERQLYVKETTID